MNPTTPSQPTPQSPPPQPAHHGVPSVVLLVVMVIGIVAGYFLNQILVNRSVSSIANLNPPSAGGVTLPPDATMIQACSDHRGVLYAKPSDIPVGPVYMVNNGKVIGVEFMLAKAQFLNGTSFKYLSGLGIKVDHVNIGLLSEGHEGYPIAHYHVDIYGVPRSVEDAIICPGSSAATATPSAKLMPMTTSSSASPTP